MVKGLRWYIAGGVLAVAGIACTVIGDRVTYRDLQSQGWAEAAKIAENPDDGVHGVSGE